MEKYIKINFILLSLLFAVTGCMEEERIVFNGSLIEFHDSVNRANALGRSFPIINETSPTTLLYQVNLVSAHLAQDLTVEYEVVMGENGTTAQSGTHYTTSGSFVIPAGESLGFVEVDIPAAAVGAGPGLLIMELQGNDFVQPSENYKSLGVNINVPEAEPAE